MIDNSLQKLLKENPAMYKALMAQVSAEKSLYKFTELMWEFVEPSNPFVGNWHLECLSDHLEAVTRGDITRLLMNVPPGTMKSLMTDVFWPAWEWIEHAHYRYVCTSYSSALTERDNGRFLQVVNSDLYRAMWGDRFKMTRESMIKVMNDKTGWKLATSTEGMGTGERGDRVIVDDPHNVKDGESSATMISTLQYFTEVLPTRLTNPLSSAMVVIMQRVRENDVSGHILEKDLGYTHVMLPMEYEHDRKCYTFLPAELAAAETENRDPMPFFEDPRTEPGDLLFAARMPEWVVDRDKKAMGPYAVAGQFQQAPVPRGGGIIKRQWWKFWPEDSAGDAPETFDAFGLPLRHLEYPRNMDFVLASVDTAYTKNTNNDYNALAVLGVWYRHSIPKVMLMHCWQKHLELGGESVPRLADESETAWRRRKKEKWGMLQWTAYECARWKVDKLLIENKSTGITLAQEIQKVFRNEQWVTQLINPKGDKETRMYSIQHLFAEGSVYAPERAWSEEAISEMEKFPKGRHDDLPDAISQGIKYLRDTGLLARRDEVRVSEKERNKYKARQEPLYDV